MNAHRHRAGPIDQRLEGDLRVHTATVPANGHVHGNAYDFVADRRYGRFGCCAGRAAAALVAHDRVQQFADVFNFAMVDEILCRQCVHSLHVEIVVLYDSVSRKGKQNSLINASHIYYAVAMNLQSNSINLNLPFLESIRFKNHKRMTNKILKLSYRSKITVVGLIFGRS